MLHRRFQETQGQFWDQMSEKSYSEDSEDSFGRLPYQLWNVNKYGSCADAAITGIMPPPLMELQVAICISIFNLCICTLNYYLLKFVKILSGLLPLTEKL